jgi:hypothetical protein
MRAFDRARVFSADATPIAAATYQKKVRLFARNAERF